MGHDVEDEAVGDNEVQGLELAVAARIHEVDHLDVVLHHKAHDVGLRNTSLGFCKKAINSLALNAIASVFII